MKRGKTEWQSGTPVTEDFEHIDCSRCDDWYRYVVVRRKRWGLKLQPRIKFFPNSHGYLCQSCFWEAPLCPCGELAVVKSTGRCRDCYMGEETKQPVETLLYKTDETADIYAISNQNETEEQSG